jgi:phage tail tape-measure protein
MTMLRSETSKVVDEIRKIPEAMTAAKRAQMADYKERLDRQIAQKEQELNSGEKMVYGRGWPEPLSKLTVRRSSPN